MPGRSMVFATPTTMSPLPGVMHQSKKLYTTLSLAVNSQSSSSSRHTQLGGATAAVAAAVAVAVAAMPAVTVAAALR